jgi:hypothetical protein
MDEVDSPMLNYLGKVMTETFSCFNGRTAALTAVGYGGGVKI